MQNLTAKELYRGVKNFKYALFRRPDGIQVGCNCKIINLKKVRDSIEKNDITRYVSFKECSFNEYLLKKTPFVKIK